LHRFHNFFNWTMTYRLDSDIPRPYGWVSELGSTQVYPPTNIAWRPPRPLSQEERAARAHPKPRLVAWLVSNCNTHSNREEYVELLRRHVPVDMFGACGERQCGRVEDHNTAECDTTLGRQVSS